MVVCTVDNITKIINYATHDNCSKEDRREVITDSHGSVAGFGSLVLKIGKQQARKTKVNYLGSNPLEEAQVRQWIEYGVCSVNYCESASVAQRIFQELNSHLSSRTYFVGNKCTLADVVLYHLLREAVRGLSYQEKEQYLHLSRWFNNLQQDDRLRGDAPVGFSRTPLY